jgi:hypothetical protein
MGSSRTQVSAPGYRQEWLHRIEHAGVRLSERINIPVTLMVRSMEKTKARGHGPGADASADFMKGVAD